MALAEATGVTVEAGVAIVARADTVARPVDWEVTAEAMAHLEVLEVTVAPRVAMEATVAPEAATGVTVEAKAVTVAQADMVAHQEEIVGQVVSPLHTSQSTPFAHIVYTESTKDKLMDKVGGMFGKKDHSSSGDSGDSGSGGYGGDSGSNNY